jgi:uncharacterized glyoxalase superfamily protein PhnB
VARSKGGGDDRGRQLLSGWRAARATAYARAKSAGADVIMELTDQDYGSRDFAVRDPEGNHWNFGTYEPT